MQTLSRTPASADACAPLSPGALAALLHGAPLFESQGADFKRGTWTFKTAPGHQVAAGQYAIVPAVLVRLAIEQACAEGAAAVLLPSPRNVSAYYRAIGGQPAMTLKDDSGFSMTLYKDLQPEGRRAWNPVYWRGCERRTDRHGRTWDARQQTFVMDDFGDLVEVPA